ncbi:MAG TPA: hypothetical protein DEU94_06305, partial [Micrococcus luteus]|nr:hypothetical protein [Micrococcus luteus]
DVCKRQFQDVLWEVSDTAGTPATAPAPSTWRAMSLVTGSVRADPRPGSLDARVRLLRHGDSSVAVVHLVTALRTHRPQLELPQVHANPTPGGLAPPRSWHEC